MIKYKVFIFLVLFLFSGLVGEYGLRFNSGRFLASQSDNCLQLLIPFHSKEKNRLVRKLSLAWKYIRHSKEERMWSLVEHRKLTRNYMSKLELGEDLPIPESFNEKLALIEALNSRLDGYLPEAEFDEFFLLNKARNKRKFIKTVKKMDFSKEISFQKLDELSSGIYSNYLGVPYELKEILSFSEKLVRKRSRALVGERVLNDGLLHFYSNLQMVKTNGAWDRVKIVLNHKIIKVLKMIVSDSIMASAGFPPFFVNDLLIKMDPDIVKMVLRDGFDKAWPHIKIKYKNKIRGELDYYIIKRVYAPLAFGVFMTTIILESYFLKIEKDREAEFESSKLLDEMMKERKEELRRLAALDGPKPMKIVVLEEAISEIIGKDSLVNVKNKIARWLKKYKISQDQLDEHLSLEYRYLLD